MKTLTKYFSMSVAAVAAGVAIFTLVNASFTAFLRGDVILAIASSLALLSFMAYDFSRQSQPLDVTSTPARKLRPEIRASFVSPRRNDNEVRSYRNSQIAA
jgi:hypothetical protein